MADTTSTPVVPFAAEPARGRVVERGRGDPETDRSTDPERRALDRTVAGTNCYDTD